MVDEYKPLPLSVPVRDCAGIGAHHHVGTAAPQRAHVRPRLLVAEEGAHPLHRRLLAIHPAAHVHTQEVRPRHPGVAVSVVYLGERRDVPGSVARLASGAYAGPLSGST